MALTKVQIDGVEFSDSTDLNVDSGTLVVDATNNRVGVGTTSPQNALVVSNGGARGIEIDPANGYLQSYNRSTSAFADTNYRASNHIFFRDATESARIDSNGRLGLGTSSPSTTAGGLDISSGGIGLIVGADGSVSTRTNSTDKIFRVGSYHYTNSEEPVCIAFGQNLSTQNELNFGGGSAALNAATYIRWFTAANNTTTAGTERMRLDSSGRLGLGTSSPDALLQVGTLDAPGTSRGGIAVKTAASTGTFGESAIYIEESSGAEGFYIGVNSDGALFFSNSGTTTPLFIGDDDRVGIGTTAPAGPLEVAVAANRNLLVTGVDNDYTRIGGIQGGTSNNRNLNLTGENLFFSTGSSSGTSFTERARIDSSGRLLVGTSSSSSTEKLVVQGTTTNSAGPGMLRLQVGSTPSTSTVDLGYVFFGDNAGNYGARILAQSEGAWTSGSSHPSKLTFSTTASGASSPTERMVIYSGGNVYIGNSSVPTGLGLQVYSNSNNDNVGSFYVRNSNTALAACVAAFATGTNSTSTSNILIRFGINSYGSSSGAIATNGTGQCTFVTVSDSRLKENIVDLPSQWENIKNLRPVEFDFIESEGGEHQIGFIAQEIQTVYPDAVGSQPLSFNEEENAEEYLTVGGWSKTEARLVKALQEAIAKIETLEQRLSDAGIA